MNSRKHWSIVAVLGLFILVNFTIPYFSKNARASNNLGPSAPASRRVPETIQPSAPKAARRQAFDPAITVLRVETRNEFERNQALGLGTLVEDYGSFVVVAASPEAVRTVETRRAEYPPMRAMDYTIAAGIARFDPLAGIPEPFRTGDGAASSRYFVVQFVAPVRDEWLDAVRAAGGEVVGYVPNQAFVVRAEPDSLLKIAKHSRVRWVGPYVPAYKTGPELARLFGGPEKPDEETSSPAQGNPEPASYDVTVFGRADVSAVKTAVTNRGGFVEAETKSSDGRLVVLRVRVSSDRLKDVVALPDVVAVNPSETSNDQAARTTLDDGASWEPSTERLDRPAVLTAPGRSFDWTGTVADASQPIRVTLAWTDPPALAGVGPVNDLDLELVVNGGVHRGTAAADGTTEIVTLPAGIEAGTPFLVRVVAAALNGDGSPGDADATDQGFTLVVSNVNRGVFNPNVAVIAAAGSTITAEQCTPGNSALDPNEAVTVNLDLQNTGTTNTTNLVATLQATGGVTNPSAPRTYGTLIAGGPAVSRPFSFKVASGTTCGATVTATLQLQDGATSLGSVTFNFTTGTLSPTTTTFNNTTQINIPAGGTTSGVGSPYPSTISVSGLTGTVTKVTARFNGLSHTFPDDMDILLVGPTGQSCILMSDTGGSLDINNVTLTFDDAAGSLPDSTQISTGTFKPTNIGAGDTFAAPAPAGPYGATLSVFNGVNPNGTWNLFAVDDTSGDTGNMATGWTLLITTSVPTCCIPPACPTITATPSVTGTNPICAGSSTTIQVAVTGGTAPYTVTLNNGGGTQTGSSPLNFTVSPSSTTTYSVQSGTDTNLCSITGSGSATVTVNQNPTTSNAGSDQTLCVTNPAATLAANTPTTGTGAWSVVTAPGGGSTATSQFSSTTSPTATFTPSPAVAGTYTLRWTISNSPCVASTDDVNIVYTPTPTVSNAGTDQTLCVTSPAATLAANTPTTGTGAWSVVTAPGGGSTATSQFSSTTSPTATFTPSPAVAGTYTLRWTISNSPCAASTDNVNIVYIAVPTTASAGPDQTICSTGSAILAANTPTTGAGAWSVVTAPGGGSTATSQFSSTTSPTATFTPSPAVAGTYTLRWTISNAPCAASTDDVVMTVTQGPTASNAGADQTLCVTTPATLAANTPSNGTGTWSVAAGPNTSSTQFSNVNSPTATFTQVGGAGTYTLRWTISAGGGCLDSTDDVTITFTAPPTTASAGADQTICSTGSATLAANTPTTGTGAWSVVTAPGGGSTATSQFSSTTSPTATFTPSSAVAGTYTLRWTISNAPCAASSDDMSLTVNAAATPANAGPDQTTLCLPTGATLAANTPTAGTPSWSVVSGPSTNSSQFSSTSSPTATFTPAGGAGTYVLRWTITPLAPCPASFDDVTLIYAAGPTAANAGTDQTICSTGSVTLAANLPTVGSGTWSVQSGPNTSAAQFSNASANNSTFTPAGGPGAYVLRWTITAPGGCPPSFDDMTVTLSPSCGELAVIYVADTQNHRIQEFDGTSWTVVVGNGTAGTAANQCNLPKAVVANASGTRIYVADTGNNRITFSTDGGTTWAIFATNGIGLHQVRGPQGLALDAAGNLYVADALNERVLRFGGLPGTALALATSGTGAGQVKGPRGLAIDNAGNLYVTDRTLHRILRIANAPTVAVANTGAAVVSGQGLGLSSVNGPEGCAVDNAGNLHVADTLNERVIQFPGGAAPGVVMTDGAGTTLGKVNRPEGVAVTLFAAGPLAGQRFLVVGDTMNNRMEGRPIATSIWQLVGTPNNVGSGVGQFRSPSKLR